MVSGRSPASAGTRCAALRSAPPLLLRSDLLRRCVLRSDLRRAQDYCTNCSGPLAAPGLYGALSGVRTQGYGDEVFVKHIADHMHTQKYPTSSGSKTLQELGFRYPSPLSPLPPPPPLPPPRPPLERRRATAS